MSVVLKASTTLPTCSACVCHKTHLAWEVEAMSIALKTSTALPACRVCVCPRAHLV